MSAHAVFYKKLRSKNLFFYLFCIVCAAFVAANILYSQKYNATMYGVMEGERGAIISYLKHIQNTHLLGLELETYKNEGREDALAEWDTVQSENQKRIQRFEEALVLHSSSPELYYNLHLLYLENGNAQKAQENLQKAQQIDPSLK
jgi:tetratricopeptide (TPR) repeat protein